MERFKEMIFSLLIVFKATAHSLLRCEFMFFCTNTLNQLRREELETCGATTLFSLRKCDNEIECEKLNITQS